METSNGVALGSLNPKPIDVSEDKIGVEAGQIKLCIKCDTWIDKGTVCGWCGHDNKNLVGIPQNALVMCDTCDGITDFMFIASKHAKQHVRLHWDASSEIRCKCDLCGVIGPWSYYTLKD